MATTTLISAIPFENTSDEVDRWALEVTYSQGTEGTSDYYESIFQYSVPAEETDPDGNTITNFTELDKTAWSLADLLALCPISQWDDVFDRQYDSVITNPPEVCTPDSDFVVPE
jgi:hypothetical protein